MMRFILFTLLGLFSLPVLAHIGPEAVGQHFAEHILIALLIGLPVGYGLLHLWQKYRNNHK